jgi:hypothetical protein
VKPGFLAVAIAFLALAGCTGSKDPVTVTTTQVASPASAASAPSVSPTALEPGNVYVDVHDSQAVGDFVGALKDVTASTCGASGADWVGSGTITNPTKAAANYRVWVAFIGADGGTVGLVQVNVDGVKAGASGDFSAPMPYAADGTLSCILRVERRAAA